MSRRKRPDPMDPTRRDFLWKGACAALTATGIASTIRDLRMINAASAATAPATDYKALVCIFLFGGNDGNNVLIPTDSTRYSQYSSARGVLALPPAGSTDPVTHLNTGVLPISATNVPSGQTYGLHPNCPELANLFNLKDTNNVPGGAGKLALLANVGTLLGPITQTEYKAGSKFVPPQLFSHSDQQLEWQTSLEDQPPKTGWGGRSADLLYTLNGNNSVSMNISLAGANTLQVGNHINEYNVSSTGAVSLNFPNTTVGNNQLAALQALINMDHTNLYESAFATQMNTALSDAASLNAAIAPTAAATYFGTQFPNTSLGQQLRMIARLIQAAPVLGHNRQIFFASIGGFDLHSGLGVAGGSHGRLLADLSLSMKALYDASVQLKQPSGADLSTQVTQFTASDFCRTLPVNNGMGADHGWGNHQMILGGAVKGGKIYGTFPTLVVNGPDDTTTGRWIPQNSVDQYAATLAKWFGVSDANLDIVFPYLYRWNPNRDLGIMG